MNEQVVCKRTIVVLLMLFSINLFGGNVSARWGVVRGLTPDTCPGESSDTDAYLYYYSKVNPGSGTDYTIVDNKYTLLLGDGQKAILTITHSGSVSFGISYYFMPVNVSYQILTLYESTYPQISGSKTSNGTDEFAITCSMSGSSYKYSITRSGNTKTFTSTTKGFTLCLQSGENYAGNLYYSLLCKTMPQTVTITFSANGGSVSPSSSTSDTGTKYGTLPTPTRPGYSFGGWYATPSLEGDPVSADDVVKSEDHALYAKWNVVVHQTYSIAYMPGQYGEGEGLTVTKTNGIDVTLCDVMFTRTGYEQGGWSLDSAGLTLDYAINENYSDESELTLYPYWQNSAIVTSSCPVTLRCGYSWISVNVTPADTSFGSVFNNVAFQNEDLIKTSNGTATYYDGIWYPSPSTFSIATGKAYVVKKSTAGTEAVTISGIPDTTAIDVSKGWNWVGPMSSTPISLDSLNHSNGFCDEDIISTSDSSATYYGGSWYGSLKSMKPGVGYKARFGNAGTVTF